MQILPPLSQFFHFGLIEFRKRKFGRRRNRSHRISHGAGDDSDAGRLEDFSGDESVVSLNLHVVDPDNVAHAKRREILRLHPKNVELERKKKYLIFQISLY